MGYSKLPSQRNKKKKSEKRMEDSPDTIKWNKMFIMEVPEGREKERARKSIENNNGWKLSKPGKRNAHPGS